MRIGTAAAARRLGCTVRRVRQLIEEGRLPAVQRGGPGGEYLLELRAVRAFMVQIGKDGKDGQHGKDPGG
ncbi:MAG: excisionase family DNA-binding protein [Polyangiales bacterium]